MENKENVVNRSEPDLNGILADLREKERTISAISQIRNKLGYFEKAEGNDNFLSYDFMAACISFLNEGHRREIEKAVKGALEATERELLEKLGL